MHFKLLALKEERPLQPPILHQRLRRYIFSFYSEWDQYYNNMLTTKAKSLFNARHKKRKLTNLVELNSLPREQDEED